jgi:hypothetical protein
MPEGTQGDGGLQETPEIPLETTEAPSAETPDEPTSEPTESEVPEDVRATVERAYKEEKAKLNGDEPPEIEPKPEAVKLGKGKKGKNQLQTSPEGDTPPPVRLNAEQKELFNALPPKLKVGVARMFLDHEQKFTRGQQDLARALEEHRSIGDVAQQFAAEWGEMGFSVPQAIAQLAATQRKLTNPNTSLDTFIKLGADLGFDVSHLKDDSAPGQGSGDISTHPQFKALQEKLGGLQSTIDNWQGQQTEAVVTQIVEDMSTVRDEKDQFGRYRYPRMHEEGYLEALKPLVSVIARTIPGISYGEALRRAYITTEGGNSSDAASGQPAKFPDTNQRAVQAAVSVRGRSAPGANGFSIPKASEIPDSPRDTVQMVYEQLKRGIQ